VLPVSPLVLNVCARGWTRSAPHADIRGTLEIATVSSDSESGDTNLTAIGKRILATILTLFVVSRPHGLDGADSRSCQDAARGDGRELRFERHVPTNSASGTLLALLVLRQGSNLSNGYPSPQTMAKF
jgi:hypothetical protein